MKSSYHRIAIGLLSVAGIYGVYRAVHLAWVCDDAFISFRYAWNLARGRGLVFNAGEYVEGFTNLLWTLLLAPFRLPGLELDLVPVSQTLGVAAYLGLLAAYLLLGRQLLHPRAADWLLWPFSFLALAAHHHLHIFATSGLETMLFTALITAGVLLQAFRPRSGAGFILLALACLTRPDGLLVYGIGALYCALYDPSPRTSPTAWLIAQLRRHAFCILTVGASFVFRWFYYGDLLPNTFYAKSAYDPYPAQGLIYTGLYFAAYWVLGFCLFTAIAAALARLLLARGITANPDRSRETAVPFLIAIICTWIGYVLWVGGDFMFGRFLVPITPLLLMAGELALRDLTGRRGQAADSKPDGSGTGVHGSIGERAWLLSATLLLAAMLLRYDPYAGRPLPVIAHIGEEHKIYTPVGVAQLKATAHATQATLKSADPVIAFVGAQAALIYYWDISTAIEAQTGLTDRTIARQSLRERGWVGHEKAAQREYLMERGAAFILRPPRNESNHRSAETLRIRGLIGEFELLAPEAATMRVLTSDAQFELPSRYYK